MLDVKPKTGFATLGVVSDILSPALPSPYLEKCPNGTSWQWHQGYIAKCKSIPCDAGKEVGPETINEATCISCKSGHFKSTRSIFPCSPCPQNTYGDSNDTKKCNACPLNSFSSENSSSINDCKCSVMNAFYRDGIQCKLCPANSITTTLVGNTDDVCKCSKNFFQEGNGATMVCKECPIDSTSSQNSKSINDCKCNSAFYRDQNNQCKLCPNNAIKVADEKTTSVEPCICKKNFYQSGYGDQMECKECPIDSYSNQGSASINDCNCTEGRVSEPIVGTTAFKCTICSVGKYVHKQVGGKNICQDCPKGKYQNNKAATACIKCPVNTYVDTVGSTASSQCKKCTADFHYLYHYCYHYRPHYFSL